MLGLESLRRVDGVEAGASARAGQKILLKALFDELRVLNDAGEVARAAYLKVEMQRVYASIFGQDLSSALQRLEREREEIVQRFILAQDRCLFLGEENPQAAEEYRINEMGPLAKRLEETFVEMQLLRMRDAVGL